MSTIERLQPSEPRGQISPQLGLRVAILGGFALAMFAIIFFRLWYLQVLTGEQYVHQAKVNDQRVLAIPAPRGEILDRSGQPIVTSSTKDAVQVIPGALPVAVSKQAAEYQQELGKAQAEYIEAHERVKAFERQLSGRHTITHAQRLRLHQLRRLAAHIRLVPIPPLPASASSTRHLFDRLAPVIKLSPRLIDERVITGITKLPYAPVTIKEDAGRGALTYLSERRNEFPGVRQEPVAIRTYKYGEMAAQVLGHVGQVNEPELKTQAFRGVGQGTVVGQQGLEYYYDRYLRGTLGAQNVQVNAAGEPIPTALPKTEAIAGHSLRLTLDLGLEQESERALRQGISAAQAAGKPADAGAFVAMEPRSGQILAIGSYPSFNPNVFAKQLTEQQYSALIAGAGSLTDRAVDGEYPTGSTFKPITAMAALEAGVITPNEVFGPGPCIMVGGENFCNAGHAALPAMALVEALKVSSDTYFFEVGERANSHGNVIQNKARELGVGTPSEIDLPEEFAGVVPDRQWLARRNREEAQCKREKHVSTCQLLAEPGAPWTVGYNMQMAVGQGDLLTDPLQMAVAYSALANAYTHEGHGWVPHPHLGMQIDDTSGALVQDLSFPPLRRVNLNYGDLSLVMEGIHKAASESGGTSADVWAGWNQVAHPVFGKTGTAQHEGKEDQSWYMCYIEDHSRPIVIATTVEQGGFGAETAAPIARLIAAKWFGQAEKYVSGSSKTA
ncbi:MAG TPA: penicillin-binding transpeptidase domain-containing protein [Solirubrobacteraceae bacterium]|jgi:penicillin-binding protein 2|nr:penicillin-binding transpeptidase domain-containing protein [Solirubrobacteraceae bacterium]